MRHTSIFRRAAMWAVLLCVGSAGAGELRGRVAGDEGQAVVWVEGAPGQVPRRDVVISHVSGRFEPYVSVGFVGNDFVLRNEDGTLHNTHLYMRLAYQKAVSQRPLHYGATLFNVALPKAGMEVRRPIKPYYRYREETGFIEVVCNPHPGEQAYVLIFDHPYAAVTGKDGAFSIPDVPAGRHEVRVWRNGVVRAWGTAEVRDGAPTEVVVEE